LYAQCVGFRAKVIAQTPAAAADGDVSVDSAATPAVDYGESCKTGGKLWQKSRVWYI